MATVANVGWKKKALQSLGKSAASAGPLDVLGFGIDYSLAKTQGASDGEAFFRATGSTLGGLGGGLAGMKLGPLGAIAGNMAGSQGGEAIAGGLYRTFFDNKKPNKRSSNMSNEFYYDEEEAAKRLGQVVGIPAGLATAYGVYQGAKGVDPSALKSAGTGLKKLDALKDLTATALRRTPTWGKVAGAVFLANALDDATGRNVKNAVFGVDNKNVPQRTSGRNTAETQNQDRRQDNYRRKFQEDVERRVQELQGKSFADSPFFDSLSRVQDENLRRISNREDFTYERALADSMMVAERSLQAQRENALMDIKARQADSLMSAYAQYIPNSVTNMVGTVFRSRYT